MYLNTKGLVVRVVPYSDTDALLSILTPEHGKLTVKARVFAGAFICINIDFIVVSGICILAGTLHSALGAVDRVPNRILI